MIKITITAPAAQIERIKAHRLKNKAVEWSRKAGLTEDDDIWRLGGYPVEFVIENPESPPRWRADICGQYWYVASNGRIDFKLDYGTSYDSQRWEAGNYCQTLDEAERVAERVRAAYRGEQP